ncbi:MAG TPA: hypothetical protein VFS19_04390 [Planctomycetota bacterium]|nr:hypothetical protein [Planctomycetota bacterium]
MKRLRPVWIVIGIGALALGAWDLAVYALEQYELAAITRRTEALKAEFNARDYTRPVLRGSPQPGNAWDHYRKAIEEIKAEDKFYNVYVNLFYAFLRGSEKADRAAVVAVLEKHAGVLDHIRRGLQCGEARFEYNWSRDRSIPRLYQGDEQAFGYLSRSKARLLVDAGRHMEAAELLLDMCLFCRDRDQNDINPALGTSTEMLDDLHAILMGGKLSPSEFARLDRELGILLEAYPDHSHSFWNHVLDLGAGFQMEAREGRQMRFCSVGDVEVRAGWREYYSYRLMNARAFRLLDHWTARLAAAERMNWMKAREVLWAVHEELESSRHGMELLSGVSIWGASNRRQEAAKLRLLRTAAHYICTGEVLELQDPFGDGPLKSTRGSSLKVWSAGRDGIDHGARGSWRGWLNEDLVLEVTR